MLKFDLEKALAGEPVVFGDGRKCVELKQFQNGIVISVDELDIFRRHEKDGTLCAHSPLDIGNHTLFMAEKPKVKKEGWVFLYIDVEGVLKTSSKVYFSESDAKFSKALHDLLNHVAIVKIEWEEEA